MRLAPLLLLLACGPTGSGTVAGPTKTKPTGPTVLPEGVTVSDGPVVKPHKVVDIELDVASSLAVACTMDGDPEEVITVESPEIADSHRIDLLGLAAGESYTCTLSIDGAVPVDFPVEVELVDAPRFTVERDASLEMSGAWTITNTTGGCFQETQSQVIIVDPEGRHRWVYDLGPGYVADIDATLTPDGDVHIGGGWGLLDISQPNRGMFRTVALDGTVIHDREEPDFGLGFNHHSEPMDDGTFLSLTTSWIQEGSRGWYGVAVERWAPDGSLPFTWDTQGMVDAGQLAWNGDENPYHANSVTWMDDADGEALLISLYGAREIWRVNRQTGLREWSFGPGGDFELLDPTGAPLGSDKWFYVQHDPDWTADGRVLLYDNGFERPGPDYSRVAEFQLDTDAMTATQTWEWTEPGFYNPVVGDADWLPNGNVLVAKGFMICWTPSSNDVSAIVEVDPRTDDVLWRMSWPDRADTLFRAERYDGCELFANNAKYCKP